MVSVCLLIASFQSQIRNDFSFGCSQVGIDLNLVAFINKLLLYLLILMPLCLRLNLFIVDVYSSLLC